MIKREYKVSDIRRIIQESTNEFKPIIGQGVESDNKKNNEKAYKDITKETSKYDGGVRATSKKSMPRNDDNKGMQDLKYERGSLAKSFKDDNISRMKGYMSKEDEKRHKKEPYGNAQVTDNASNIVNDMEEKFKNWTKAELKGKTSGLTSREMKDDIKKVSKEGVLGENKRMKMLYFKNTTFLSEEHMSRKIPDDFKIEGNKFIVKDKGNNEYLVEWCADTARIRQHKNQEKLNEELNRMRELFDFKSGGNNKDTFHLRRVNEDNEMIDMLNKSRNIF